MELSFTTLATTTSANANEALPISRSVLDVAVTLRGSLIILYAPKTNAADILIGFGAGSSFFYELEAGQYYGLPGTNLPQYVTDLSKWFIKSTGVSVPLQLIYVKQY